MVEKKEISSSTLNIIINALKFYYGEILKRQFAYEIKRPKKRQKVARGFKQGRGDENINCSF